MLYVWWLLLNGVDLDLLYISKFERFEYSNFKRFVYSKFVKLRRLYGLLISEFSLGIHVLIGLKRTTLVLLFPVFFMHDFNELLLLNSLDATSLSLKKATGFVSREVK